MFSEVVKLTPQIDRGALNSMFQTLNSRFGEVTRKFGAGFKNALKLGGIAAIAGAVLSKLLNPLQKAEEVIDRILAKGDDAATNAEEFGSDPGKLLRLEALAQAKGLAPEQLRAMIGKFQGALAKEQEVVAAPDRIREKIVKFDLNTEKLRKQLELASDPEALEEVRRTLATEKDPTKRAALAETIQGANPADLEAIRKRLEEAENPRARKALEIELRTAETEKAQGGTLREFVNEKDTADAFFKFVQSLQKLDKSRQTVVQSEIFGERMRGKAAEFLNAGDFADVLKRLPTTEALRGAAERTGKLADEKDLLQAIRESEDFVNKSKIVKESMVRAIDQSERQKLRHEDEGLKRFDVLMPANIAVQELTEKFDKFTTELLANFAPEILAGVNTLTKLGNEFLPSFKEVKTFVSNKLEALESTALAVYEWFTKRGGVTEKLYDLTPGTDNYVENAKGVMEDPLGALQNDLRNFQRFLETTWAEFKSSKFWRITGGGK